MTVRAWRGSIPGDAILASVLSFQLEDLLFYEGLQKSEFLSIILADFYTKPSSPFITKFLEVFFFFGKKRAIVVFF